VAVVAVAVAVTVAAPLFKMLVELNCRLRLAAVRHAPVAPDAAVLDEDELHEAALPKGDVPASPPPPPQAARAAAASSTIQFRLFIAVSLSGSKDAALSGRRFDR